MKIKKFIASVLFAFALIAGGFSQAQPVAAALNKKQVVSIIKRDNQNTNSGKLKTNIAAKIKKESSKVYTNFDFQFNRGKQLVHQVGTVQYKNKKINIDVWYDIAANRAYINNNGKWEYKKVDFNKVNTKSFNNLSGSLFKTVLTNGKLKHQGDTYTLRSKLNIKKYLKQFMRLLTNKVSKKDAKYIKNKVKVSNLPVTYKVNNKKFVSAKTKYNGDFNKELKIKVNLSIGNFGEYEALTLPEEVKNAVEMDDD